MGSATPRRRELLRGEPVLCAPAIAPPAIARGAGAEGRLRRYSESTPQERARLALCRAAAARPYT